jgi:hypothetical protein
MPNALHTAALSHLPRITLNPERLPAPPVPVLPRPVWDDGTDYDIPTYLRRARRHASRRNAPGRSAPFEAVAAWSRLGG